MDLESVTCEDLNTLLIFQNVNHARRFQLILCFQAPKCKVCLGVGISSRIIKPEWLFGNTLVPYRQFLSVTVRTR